MSQLVRVERDDNYHSLILDLGYSVDHAEWLESADMCRCSRQGLDCSAEYLEYASDKDGNFRYLVPELETVDMCRCSGQDLGYSVDHAEWLESE